MKLKLPVSVVSPQDLNSLLLEVRAYARWQAHQAIKQRVNAKRASESPVVSLVCEELLQVWSARKPVDAESLAALIKALEAHAANAPALTITLAAPPTSGIKTTLTAWCREHIAPNALVNFQFNANLLGGMVVRYGSHVFDWSFRRQILEHRHSFAEVLRRV